VKELNRKTAEANKKYQEIASNVTEETVQPEVELDVVSPVVDDESIAEVEVAFGIATNPKLVNTTASKGAKNVFKTVEQTKKPSVTGDNRVGVGVEWTKRVGVARRWRKSSIARKILAFKYFARDLLDDPNIPRRASVKCSRANYR
jgi:hypothetical protein